jgi:hypothetical protein
VLIAEELLLLLTDDTTGKPVVGSTELEHGLAGAVLLELAMTGRVDVEPGKGLGRKERLVVVDASPSGEPVLDEALRRIAQKPGRKPDTVVGALRKGLRDHLYGQLVTHGMLRAEQTKVLGLFPVTRWPCVEPTRKQPLRQALYDALVVGVEPSPPVAAVISLLYAIRAVPKVVGRGAGRWGSSNSSDRSDRLDKKRVQARAKQISEGAWAAAAVRRAVDAVNAATVAAITAATAAGAAGG